MKPREAKQSPAVQGKLTIFSRYPPEPTGLHIATRTAGTAFRKAEGKQMAYMYCDMDVLLKTGVLQNGHSFQCAFTLPFDRL